MSRLGVSLGGAPSPSPGWRGWATSSPPARRARAATTPSATSSGKAARSTRSWARCTWWPRVSRAARPCWRWPRRTGGHADHRAGRRGVPQADRRRGPHRAHAATPSRSWRRGAHGTPVIRPATGHTIGVVGQTWRAWVSPGGALLSDDGSALLDWWVAAEDRWHTPSRELTCRQRLVDGVPVVETAMRVPGGDAVQTVYAVADGGGLAVVALENRSPAPIAVALSRRDVLTSHPPSAVPFGEGRATDALVLPVGHRSTTLRRSPSTGEDQERSRQVSRRATRSSGMAAPDRGRRTSACPSLRSPRHASLPLLLDGPPRGGRRAGGVPRSRGGARPAGRLRRTVGGRRRRPPTGWRSSAAANRSGALAGRRGVGGGGRGLRPRRPPSWRADVAAARARRSMSTPTRCAGERPHGPGLGAPADRHRARASSTCSRHRSLSPARPVDRGIPRPAGGGVLSVALRWHGARPPCCGPRRPSGASLLRPRRRGRPRTPRRGTLLPSRPDAVRSPSGLRGRRNFRTVSEPTARRTTIDDRMTRAGPAEG